MVPKRYWSDLKGRFKSEGSEVYDKIVRFKMITSDGKHRETDCFLTRLILSVPTNLSRVCT